MIQFFVRGDSTVTRINLNGEEAVRRLICYLGNSSSSNLLYKSEIIATFNINNNINIEFESYYGFPKISDFSVDVDPNAYASILVDPNAYASILVDILPCSDVTDDYITKRKGISQ